MGWTKHGDAVLAHRDRLVKVRAEIRRIIGDMDDPVAYRQAARLLREHDGLCSALAFGHRDGVMKSELGVTIGYTHKDMGQVVEELISKGPDQFTFRRRRHR
jgi:hypothetical protein